MIADAAKKRPARAQYEPWCYDQYFCLKPPLLFILGLLFLCRGFLMPLIILATSFKGTGNGDMTVFVTGPEHAASLLTAIPAVLVLYALVRRSPSAGKVARWSWKNARLLIVLSAVLDAAVGLMSFETRYGQLTDQSILVLLRLLFAAYVLVFVLASRRVRDALADFPAADAPEAK